MYILVLAFITGRTGYMVGERQATRMVVLLTAVTPALSLQLNGHLSEVGYSSMGLQGP